MALALVLSPVTAIISAKSMSILWDWFVLRDYGAGPSLAGWFGISTILGAAVSTSLVGVTRDKSEVDPISSVVSRAVGMWIGFGVMLAMAWVVGFALHWH